MVFIIHVLITNESRVNYVFYYLVFLFFANQIRSSVCFVVYDLNITVYGWLFKELICIFIMFIS